MNKFFTLLLSLFVINLSAQNISLDVLLNSVETSHLVFTNGDLEFSTVENRDGFFTQFNVEGLTKSYDLGNPDLPVYSKLIEVPDDADIIINVINKFEKHVDLTDLGYPNQLLPAQRSIFKNEDSNKVRFIYNATVYSSDEFYSQELIKVERLGTMRGKSIARVQIAPFAYNPLSNILNVVEDLEFKIEFSSSIENSNPAYYSRGFETNFSKLINGDVHVKHDFTSSPMRMIVLSDPMFADELQDFIAWKTRLGFDIIEAYKGDEGVGNTAESMKAFVQSFYDNATEHEPAPTYLLIVGDHEQIPSFDMGPHVSDMYYCEFDGNGDYFPEMFFGRFSASSVNELLPQIDKTLQYEQYTMPDPSYLAEVVMVAGVDADWASVHGNGQINYGTDYYFNPDHNLTTYTYLYPESASSVSESEIVEHISQGVGFGNYTAHCGPAGWSDPSFEIYDVAGLQNEDEYGLLIGNCCQSNTFDGTTCLGEALLRAEKKGAVGYIGGTDNTLWDEDYYWGVGNGSISANPTYEETSAAVYDCSFHENGEEEEVWTITQGQLLHSGNWAVTESGSSNTEYYWEIYMLMGDPTVLTYYGVPSILSVEHPTALPLGSSSISVSTEQYTYVAVNQNGILLDASYTDASGNVILDFDPLSSMEPIEIVASKQNRQVYIAEINMMSSDAPFVAFAGMSINDGASGNSEAEVGESFTLDVDLQNFGMVEAGALSMVVTCDNSAVTVSSETVNIGAIGAEATTTLTDAISIDLTGSIEDQQSIVLTFTITDADGNEWVTYGNFIINAPDLEFDSYTLNDANENGFIDFGESVVLNLVLGNVGHASSLQGLALITSDFPFLQISDDEISFNSIVEGGEVVLSVPMSLDEDAPAGESYEVNIIATTEGNYSAEYTLTFVTSNCNVGAMEIEFNLTTDWFSDEIAWSMIDAEGNEIAAADFESLDQLTSYEESFCVANNSYVIFEIIDYYGDGVNSEGYSIVVCGEVIASGSDYDDGETVSFIAGCDQSLAVGCTDPEAANYDEDAIVDDGSCQELGVQELAQLVSLYPNPAQKSISVSTDGLDVASIILMEMTGKELIKTMPLSSRTIVNLENLEAGSYLMRLKLKNGRSITKSVIVL